MDTKFTFKNLIIGLLGLAFFSIVWDCWSLLSYHKRIKYVKTLAYEQKVNKSKYLYESDYIYKDDTMLIIKYCDE